MSPGSNIKRVALAGVSPAPRGSAAGGPADLLIGSGALGMNGAIALLVPMAGLRWASIWARDGTDAIRCVCEAGDAPSRPVGRQVARRLLDGEEEQHGQRRVLVGVTLGGHEQPLAALVGRAAGGQREDCLAVLSAAAPTLSELLLHDIHAGERAVHERGQLDAIERRLTRVGLDLHDGPIQELAALAADVRLLSDQLDVVLSDHRHRALMRGRIEDVDAQLIALDHGLRQISREVRAGQVAPKRHFRAALEDTIHAFAERTGIRPNFTLAGPVGKLSDSQQIALLNIVAEALSNVRKHADASAVEVVVRASAQGAEATIRDNGRGFDAEAKRGHAPHRLHTGLVAIKERVSLLGGTCSIESRRGGPTRVHVVLPRWTPAAAPSERAPRAHAVASAGRGNGASSFSTA